MGNWLTQSLCPEEQVLWVAAKSGDLATLREGLARLTPETRSYAEWRDPLYGYSPLANACSQGHLLCAQALIAHGVDCNVRDSQGNTALHIATYYGKSEVVRLLLESPGVDYFAKTLTKAQTALDIAREQFRHSDGRWLKYIQCVEQIEKKLCLYSGWLYERTDNILSIASGISGLDSWKKRYAMVLRTAARDVVEIDLFPMKPGERRPPVPSSELVYKPSDGIQQSDEPTWLNRKDYRLSLKVSRKQGSSLASSVRSMDFACSSQAELAAWKTFLTTLLVNAPESSITSASRNNNGGLIAQSYHPVTSFARTSSPTQAAVMQEQRDLERALKMSQEEAQRHSRTQAAPSAPLPSDTMLETFALSQTLIGPDGVEIVQLLRDDDVAHLSPHMQASNLAVENIIARDAGALRPDECIICFDAPQEAVCVPCGHNAVCMDCAQELLDATRICPVCRQQIREVIRLYRV